MDIENVLSIAGIKKIKPPEETCGIYFLIKEGSVVYIGKSWNVYERVTEHVRRGVDFQDAYFVITPVDELDAVERGYIEEYKPEYNIRHCGREKKKRKYCGVIGPRYKRVGKHYQSVPPNSIDLLVLGSLQ